MVPVADVVILGDMLELGSGSSRYHEELAKCLAALRPSRVLLCGPEMEALWKIVADQYQARWFPDIDALLAGILPVDPGRGPYSGKRVARFGHLEICRIAGTGSGIAHFHYEILKRSEVNRSRRRALPRGNKRGKSQRCPQVEARSSLTASTIYGLFFWFF